MGLIVTTARENFLRLDLGTRLVALAAMALYGYGMVAGIL